jgi:hypothetical protein
MSTHYYRQTGGQPGKYGGCNTMVLYLFLFLQITGGPARGDGKTVLALGNQIM